MLYLFIVQCVRFYLNKSRCHITPEEISKRRERKEEYIKLFNTDTKTTEETERFLQIEDEISVTEILLYYHIFTSIPIHIQNIYIRLHSVIASSLKKDKKKSIKR